jgi:two-component system LytT family sensor kinase
MLEQNYLVTLLVKLAVAASLASVLVRSNWFQRMLIREDRTVSQRLLMALVCSGFFGAGVATRVLAHGAYAAVDLALEGSLVMGMVGGYVTGLGCGILISIPAMANGELLSMPLFAAAGVLGGLLRDLAPDPEDVWRFTPFFDLSIYRLFRVQKYDVAKTVFSLGCVFVILFAEVMRLGIAWMFPARVLVFSIYRPTLQLHPWMLVALFASTLFATVIPIKIWNNNRNEKKLESQQLLLNEARLAALQRQINPHFLFNTLNSVASLIRTNPDQARAVVYKLSNILRRLLRKHDNFNPLREELSFIDDYLAIEMVRFGEKLKFVKEIDPETLDRLAPSMLLQPIIENSIRHGLSSKVDGGIIRVRSRLAEGKLHLTVQDNGIGIPENKLAQLLEQGIGISNVNERLKVLFGSDYRMSIDSRLGAGTTTEIEFPEIQTSIAAVS